MIKNVMEVNKKVGAGAQKSGPGAADSEPNKRVRGVRAAGAAEGLAEASPGASEAEQIDGAEVRGALAGLEGFEQFNGAARELVARLAADYPEIRFRAGKRFMFRPSRTVVVEGLEGCDGGFGGGNEWGLQLLHEVGHALSGHRGFRADVERLKMEREAWERARELGAAYNIWYDEEFVEAALDTYRDWLHRRSRCAECGLTRYQGRDGRWHCPGCEGL